MRRNKRDMYIDYNQKYGNRRNKHRLSKKSISIIVVVFLALSLGYGAYYLTNMTLKDYDKNLINRERINQSSNKNEGLNKDNTSNSTIEQLSDNTNTHTNLKDSSVTNVKGDTPMDNPASIDNGNLNGDVNDNNINDNNTNNNNINDNNANLDDEEFMPDFVDHRTPVKVKGIYVTGPRAGTDKYMSNLVDLVDTTELNTMVIDIKNDNGEVTYKMDQPMVQDIGAGINYIPNINELISSLKEKNIYLIARIVAFKDPILAEKKPEYSLKMKDGTIFRDKDGLSWVNPYKKEVWDYLISVAKEAVDLGFDEIQFDYIRFSTDSGMKDVDFGETAEDKTKMDIITEFTKYACESLKPLGVYVSADVYGTIIDSEVDAKIVGQNYADMAKYLDYISPMIYPSHYANGTYGIDHPDLEPYKLIKEALLKSKSVLNNDNKTIGIVRPWLQDFTASWLKNYKSYGEKEVREQIKAVYDAGYEEWILWNGNTNYTKEALLKE